MQTKNISENNNKKEIENNPFILLIEKCKPVSEFWSPEWNLQFNVHLQLAV